MADIQLKKRLHRRLEEVNELRQDIRPRVLAATRDVRSRWELFEDWLQGAALYAQWHLTEGALDELERLCREAQRFRGASVAAVAVGRPAPAVL